jgi:hypothetical protein
MQAENMSARVTETDADNRATAETFRPLKTMISSSFLLCGARKHVLGDNCRELAIWTLSFERQRMVLFAAPSFCEAHWTPRHRPAVGY